MLKERTQTQKDGLAKSYDRQDQELTIGFTHNPESIGGPGSFQQRLIRELKKSGWRVVYPKDKILPDVILVVGGSRRLFWLLWCKRSGSRIVHRLDGINWRHRVLRVSLRYKIVSEIRNFLARIVRRYLADVVIYQSRFVRDWWNSDYGITRCDSVIIHNFVDCAEFRPRQEQHSKSPIIICAESRVVNDPISRFIIRSLSERLCVQGKIRGIHVLGGLGEEEIEEWSSLPGIKLIGPVPRAEMPWYFQQADIFLNLDINAACPNAVIEAMASGLPVVGFNTGALGEMVPKSAGALADYGGNPWDLDVPDCDELTRQINVVIPNIKPMSREARLVAEAKFSSEYAREKYIKLLFEQTR